MNAADLWADGFPHDAPDQPLSIDMAHMAMRRHRRCSRDSCPRKDAAWQTLVAAGKIVPDSRRAVG